MEKKHNSERKFSEIKKIICYKIISFCSFIPEGTAGATVSLEAEVADMSGIQNFDRLKMWKIAKRLRMKEKRYQQWIQQTVP